MNKEEYKTLEEIKRLDSNINSSIRRKEKEIEILKSEINQLYDFSNEIQRLGEIESNRINSLEGKSE